MREMHDVDDSHEMHAPGIQNTGDPVVDSSQHSTRPQTRKKSTLADITRTLSMQLHPQRPVAEAPGFLHGVKAIIFGSYLNVLLVCIPVSWVLHFIFQPNPTNTQDTLIFIFSFLSIIPLAKLLAFATDELSMRVGQTLAGLLNATLGNAVELIVSIIALVQCQLQVVQSSLVGSILSNLLLVLGMCFFAGGMRFSEQGFGMSSTQLNSSLLTVSVIAVLLPAAFHFVAGAQIVDSIEGPEILSLSHGAAIILLFIYLCYLVFQLFSHKGLYEDSNDEIMKSKKYVNVKMPFKKHSRQSILGTVNSAEPEIIVSGDTVASTSTHLNGGAMNIHDNTSSESHMATNASEAEAGRALLHREEHQEEVEEVEIPTMSLPMTIGLLAVVTVLVAVTAEWLVSSIDGLTASGHITKEFVGIILLPIVGNAAEHVTAVTVSVKDKLTLSLGVAVGSSIQIALFVIPFIVTLGWIIGKPLTLLFDPFESVVLFLSVIVVNYTVADGKSNWLEGMILMCLYIMLAVIFWFYPGVNIAFQTC
ncbi:hypothetical protein EW026_g119 [Hermanssonia centrifuga]|uniref:Sodium/calcium exchanger membrane region domain-containing protein n=1 Tax=Hermanssonia centrifuga TaxID=98765 RepID=A0A4S4KWL6_9APHY|nr:hypothetical protein EW026_g119 [Hermanssonia centrifuga]